MSLASQASGPGNRPGPPLLSLSIANGIRQAEIGYEYIKLIGGVLISGSLGSTVLVVRSCSCPKHVDLGGS